LIWQTSPYQGLVVAVTGAEAVPAVPLESAAATVHWQEVPADRPLSENEVPVGEPTLVPLRYT
jgi:hypothetical protein